MRSVGHSGTERKIFICYRLCKLVSDCDIDRTSCVGLGFSIIVSALGSI